ncbi:MAG TPA: class II aldolase/adducin family protein [Ktedonobacterales bacterium]|jgi:L-fuculose-phosphate aldolase
MLPFSTESLELRRKLAYACRILAANGQNDTVYGHVSHRQAGEEGFWMKPAALGLDEIIPDTLIRLDLDGTLLEGELPRHVEYPIHAEIFRARPEVTCVIHTHPLSSIAFAATNQPLRAVSHEGAQFTPPDVPRFTQTSDLIVSRELGEAVAATLGTALACYLRNHGIVVAAATIEEAVVAAINLERASQVQLLAVSAYHSFHWTADEESLRKRARIYTPQAMQNVWNYYCRRIGPL